MSETTSQKWTHLCLVTYCFVKLSQNVCLMSNQYTQLINSNILICQMCLQIMEGHMILLRFLGILIHNWREFMSEVLYLHQTFTDYVSDYCTDFVVSTCQMWLQLMVVSMIQFNCREIFIHVWNFVTSSNFYRLCVKMKCWRKHDPF